MHSIYTYPRGRFAKTRVKLSKTQRTSIWEQEEETKENVTFFSDDRARRKICI